MGKKNKKTGGNPGQKKSRKQILKEQQEMVLKLKLEEEEKERQQKLEKEKQKQLAKLAKEKQKRLLLETEIRDEKLSKSCELFNEIQKETLKRNIAQREQEIWEQYIQCDIKPNPTDMDGLNYYLYKWKNDNTSDQIQNFFDKINEVFEIINSLKDYIRIPLNESNSTVKLWKEMKQRFQDELSSQIDNETYNIIHDVEKHMETIDKFSAKLIQSGPYFALGIWAKKQIADSCPSPDRSEPHFMFAELPEVNVSVTVPYQLTYQFYVIRVNWFKYDCYSDTSRTSKPKPMPDVFFRDLYQYIKDELELKEKVKNEYDEERRQRKERRKRRRKERAIRAKGSKSGSENESALTDSTLLGDSIDMEGRESVASIGRSSVSDARLSRPSTLSETSSEPELKTPSETMLQIEEANVKYLKRYLEMYLEPETDELNLRKYMILGGVYHIDFLEALPQPVILPDRSVLCLTYGEPVIKHIEFDWKNNTIQRKSLKKLREYFDELSKCLDLGRLDQRASLRDVFMGGETRQSKYYIPGELKSMVKDFRKGKLKKKRKKKKKGVKENEDQADHQDEEAETGEEEEVKTKEKHEGDEDDLDKEINLEEESSSDEDDDEDIINEYQTVNMVDDGQDEDAFDEKRRYNEEISILEFDEINFKPEIFIKLHKEVLWFERPILVTWDSKNKYWSTAKGMENIKFDEAKQELSFRLGLYQTPIGLAVPRYINLPLLKWELKPIFSDSLQKAESVMVSLDALNVSVTLIIKGKRVCINSIKTMLSQDTGGQEVEGILDRWIGKYYKLDQIIQILEGIGVDIFPDHDAYLYISVLPPKHWICEKHLHMCMALACTTHQFRSSKWNQIIGQKKLVLNFKETFPGNFNINDRLVLVTPERARFLNTDDISYEFDDAETEGEPFYPDFYWLVQENASTLTKLNMESIDMTLVDTVYEMLNRSRIFSYS